MKYILSFIISLTVINAFSQFSYLKNPNHFAELYAHLNQKVQNKFSSKMWAKDEFETTEQKLELKIEAIIKSLNIN